MFLTEHSNADVTIAAGD
uniref:Uncharacterized protein n=1 Tax=Anguilla anguilla TaxID=7936 RepID=A0A0E9TDD5_ANGAN